MRAARKKIVQPRSECEVLTTTSMPDLSALRSDVAKRGAASPLNASSGRLAQGRIVRDRGTTSREPQSEALRVLDRHKVAATDGHVAQ